MQSARFRYAVLLDGWFSPVGLLQGKLGLILIMLAIGANPIGWSHGVQREEIIWVLWLA